MATERTQCGKCRSWISIKKNKDGSFKGVIAICKCGSKQLCIDDNGYITRWRDVK